MPTAKRHDPLLGYNFQVSLADTKHTGSGSGLTTFVLSTTGIKTAAGFSEISGLESRFGGGP